MYEIKLKYRSGKSNAEFDGLSKHPLRNVELFPNVVNTKRFEIH